jgi:hypothetical protein
MHSLVIVDCCVGKILQIYVLLEHVRPILIVGIVYRGIAFGVEVNKRVWKRLLMDRDLVEISFVEMCLVKILVGRVI